MLKVAPRAGAWIETPPSTSNAPPPRPSLPVRERGSKPNHLGEQPRQPQVAPRAGAWIETRVAIRCLNSASGRSPCGSVDRNNASGRLVSFTGASLPVRERGSKPGHEPRAGHVDGRSPCGSVDRNSDAIRDRLRDVASLPVRERGSKRHRRGGPRGIPKSLPVRERGSKHVGADTVPTRGSVAPRAGAWIETRTGPDQTVPASSLPVRERGSKLATDADA